MKIVGIVLACLAALVVLLFVIPIHIICRFSTDRQMDFTVALRVLFVKIPLLPKKKRLPNLKRFRKRELKKRIEKQQKRLAAKEKKKRRKLQKQLNKKKKAKQRKNQAVKAKPKRSVMHIIKLVLALVKNLFERFGKYLRVKIHYLDITAAAPDPAAAAVMYGGICAVMETVWTLISGCRNFAKMKKSDISIRSDFLEQKPSVAGKITFSICLWQIALTAILAGKTALSMEHECNKNETAKEREARLQAEAEARAALVHELKNGK